MFDELAGYKMKFWGVLLISFTYTLSITECLVPQKIPERLLCADAECSEPISEATVVLKKYNALKNLSLVRNQKVSIYGKSAGKGRKDGWLIEVDGKRGFIPKDIVLETKVLKKAEYSLTTENEIASIIETAADKVINSLTNDQVPLGAFLLPGAAADAAASSNAEPTNSSPPKDKSGGGKVDEPVAEQKSDIEQKKSQNDETQSFNGTGLPSPPNNEKITETSEIPSKLEDEDNTPYAQYGTDNEIEPTIEAVPENVIDSLPNEQNFFSIFSGSTLDATAPTKTESASDSLTNEQSTGTDEVSDKVNAQNLEIEKKNVSEQPIKVEVEVDISQEDAVSAEVNSKVNGSKQVEGDQKTIDSEDKNEKESTKTVAFSGEVNSNLNDSKQVEGDQKTIDFEVINEKESIKTEEGQKLNESYQVNDSFNVEMNSNMSVDVKTENTQKEQNSLKSGDEIKISIESEFNDTNKNMEISKIENETEKISASLEKRNDNLESPVGIQKEESSLKLNGAVNDSPDPLPSLNQTETVPETLDQIAAAPPVNNITEDESSADNSNLSIEINQPDTPVLMSNDQIKSQLQPSLDELDNNGESNSPELGGIDEKEKPNRVKRDFGYQPNNMHHYQNNHYPNNVYMQSSRYSNGPNDKFSGNAHGSFNYKQNIQHNPTVMPTPEYKTATPSSFKAESETFKQNEAVFKSSSTQVPIRGSVSSTDKIDFKDVPKKEESTESTKENVPDGGIPKEEHSLESTDSSKENVPDGGIPKDEHSLESTDSSKENVPDGDIPKEEQSLESTDSSKEDVPNEDEKKEHSSESTDPSNEDAAPSSPAENTEPESNWFSFKFITDLFQGSEKLDAVDLDLKADEENPSLVNEESKHIEDEICSADKEFCERRDQLTNKLLDESLFSSSAFISDSDDLLEALLDSLQKASSGPFVCLVVTACAVVAFSLGYNLIENRKRDGQLVAKINTLEREYLVVKKESNLLKDQLQIVNEQSTSSEEYLSSYQSQISALTEECESLKATKAELEDQLVELEKELQTVTESNLEINNLLSESLSTPDGSQVLFETVETLKGKLENQNIEMKELNRLLNEKSVELENIRKDLKTNQETKKSLQEKLTTLKREKEEEVLLLKESNRDLSTQLDELLESKSLEELKLSNDISKLQIALNETQTMLGDRIGEIDALKDAISKLQKNAKDEDLNVLYDVARVKGKLTQAEAERDNYKEKFHEEEGARKLLEGHVQVISKEVALLNEKFQAAEKEKNEASTKVQVLSNYFKEKESQLQKELGLQESMWLQKQSDEHTIYEQLKSLREENERYKLQIESLKKEIDESESDYKAQIAKAEQKSHENWLERRQFERKLKESQNEATQLRNRLTLVEKNATNHSTDDLKQSISESNGDPSSPPPTLPARFMTTATPPFMMFQPPPPPPGDYLPPPPLVFPEARPPTLGRISSPPLDHRFSPPPPPHMPPYLYDPASPYSGHHSPSPPPPHRPVPKTHRDMSAEQKDSIPPGYSEHQKERPNRRSKR